MRAVVTIAGGQDERAGLLDWLRREDGLRGRVSGSGPPVTGHMGAVTDIITVAVGGGGVATVLVASVSAWLRGRRSDVSVEIEVDGRRVVVDAKRVKGDPESLTRLIESAGAALEERE